MSKILIVSSSEHELHPPPWKDNLCSLESMLAWVWEPWKKWVDADKPRLSPSPSSSPVLVYIRSQCPCCDGLSPNSWKHASLYWDILSGMWTAAIHQNQTELFDKTTGCPDETLPMFWERAAETFSRRIAWNASPQLLPSTLTDDTRWTDVMRRGMFILWDSSFLTSETHFEHHMTLPLDVSMVSFYDIEWLLVKWTKGLSSYDDDITIVVPAYPSDELNRPLPPWLIRRVFRRYSQNPNRMFLEPLRLLVENEEGYEILNVVYTLMTTMKKEDTSKKLAFLSEKSRSLSLTCPQASILLWDSNYTVLTFHQGGPPPKMYPTILLSAWLGRTMMWIGSPYLENLDTIWEGLWTLRVYHNHSHHPPHPHPHMFLGEYVLTEEEKTTQFSPVLQALRRHAGRAMNWSLTKRARREKGTPPPTMYNHLRRIVYSRWSTLLKQLVQPPQNPLPQSDYSDYSHSYEWIDDQHVQDHFVTRNPLHPGLQALHQHFHELNRRNLYLWMGSTLGYQDSQIRCLEHLSMLDPDRQYPELHNSL